MNALAESVFESSTACGCGCRGDREMHEALESGLMGEIWRQRSFSRRPPPRAGGARPASPRPRPRPVPRGPRRIYLRAPYAVAYPYESEPSPGPSEEPDSEYNRWVQDCLNRIFGLSLAANGILDQASRSAIRRLQQQEGLPVSGIISPATEKALRRLCGEDAESAEEEWLGETGHGTQKNWYYFDVYWRGTGGSLHLLEKTNTPWLLTAAEASRLYDTLCFKWQNNTRGRADGKLMTRCYQWFPVSSRWVACKNVAGFSRGMCNSDESELGETQFWEMKGGGRAQRRGSTGSTPRRTVNLGTIVICGGKPFRVLNEFRLNSASLRGDAAKNHFAEVDAIAGEIVARWLKSTPVPSVCLEGHTDTTGKHDYNFHLGLRRAQAVKNALCKALVTRAVKAGRPDIAKSMTFVVNSLGEDEPLDPPQTPAKSRRVAVHLLREKVQGEACVSSKKSVDSGLGTCLNQCEREFQSCRESSSLIDCLRKKKRCERECRGIPV